ncbi:MAG: hypothetical protein R3F65_05570 [bacterium]
MRGPFAPALTAALIALWASGCKNIEEGQADPGSIGAACSGADDCTEVEDPEPVCLKMPAGYCSAECGGGLFDCDDQSICDQLGDRAFFCLDGCLTENGSGDCRADYRCSPRTEVINADGREVGVCVPKCEQDADCEAGRRCDTGSGDCVPRGEKATGAACTTNASCNGGLCITAPEFREGYCSSRCGSQFQGCEPGSVCETVDGAAVCLATCQSNGDCRGSAGYICRQIAEKADQSGDVQPIRACVPRCQSDAECGDGNHCEVDSGLCAPGAGDPNPLGAFCAGDGDCQSGDCLEAAGWSNGYCTEGCRGDGDCGGGVCATAAGADRCLAGCDVDLDCRAGYICDEGGCRAPCQADSDCDGERICSRSTGRCVIPGQGAGEVERRELGTVSVGGALSAPITLDVPADAIGFAILADGAGDDLMVIGEMTDPRGRKVYDFQDPFGSEYRFFPSADQITQFVPSSPRSTPQPGAYTFRLIKEGGTSSIEVSALVKTSAGEPQQGTLDVNFIFAGVSGISGSSAAGDADFQAAVREMRRIYAQQGVTIDQVSYCDVPASDADRFRVIDSVDGATSELSRMFKLSARAGDFGCQASDAINFFLVDEIVGGRAGYIILGIAGGIPGPATVNGTGHSGVAVTMAGFRRKPIQLAQTMAHEGGHYLGLFHTTEAEGTAFDPLADTPECGNSQDRNADGVVDTSECRSSGADYLMFWAAGDDAEQLSRDQGFILLRNPAIR